MASDDMRRDFAALGIEVHEPCICCRGYGFVDPIGLCPLCDGIGNTSGMNNDELPYRVVELRGKGMSLLASRNIESAELVISEAALLAVQGVEAIRRDVAFENEVISASLNSEDMREEMVISAADGRLARSVGRALAEMPLRCQDAFLELADAFPGHGLRIGMWVEVCQQWEDGPPCGARGFIFAEHDNGCFVVEIEGQEWQPVERSNLVSTSTNTITGILLTNGVSVDDEDISFVYSQSSRINHSCVPNAVVIVCRKGERSIFALQPIAKGEEICISYIEDFAVAEKHADFRARIASVAEALSLDADMLVLGLFRQQLFQKWGFWCNCPRCLPSTERSGAALARWCEVLVETTNS